MEQKVLINAWREILPKGVFASFGKLECDLSSLSYREKISIGSVNKSRMLEFASGRLHAREALMQMGISFAELPIDKLTGTPVWPKGVVGSITHIGEFNFSHVAAAVASSEEYNALGVDVEYSALIHPSIWSQFLTPKEFDLVQLTPVAEKSKLVSKIWSLKEAAIKASSHGDMLSWIVYKSEFSNTFKLVSIDKKLELDGMAIFDKSVVLAIVYKHNNKCE